MALNDIKYPLPILEYQTSEDFVDLTPGVFTTKLDVEIEGEIDVAGGAANSTLQSEAVRRLVERMRLMVDGDEFVDLSGRLMSAVSFFGRPRGSQREDGLADLAVQTTPFFTKFSIDFARGWLINPFDTVLPPFSTRQEFRLYVQWERGVVNAGDDAGTAAFGVPATGDRTITFTDGPRMRVVQHYAEQGRLPWYAPAYRSFEVDRFSAADPRLQHDLNRTMRLDAMLIASREGVEADPTDALINDITFRAASRRYIDAVPWETLRNTNIEDFEPEIIGANSPSVEDAADGYVFIRFADGGKLGNLLNTGAISNPMLEFDVNAPASGEGQITIVTSELIRIPGLTRVQS